MVMRWTFIKSRNDGYWFGTQLYEPLKINKISHLRTSMRLLWSSICGPPLSLEVNSIWIVNLRAFSSLLNLTEIPERNSSFCWVAVRHLYQARHVVIFEFQFAVHFPHVLGEAAIKFESDFGGNVLKKMFSFNFHAEILYFTLGMVWKFCNKENSLQIKILGFPLDFTS